MRNKTICIAFILLSVFTITKAQKAIPVGKGSYAEYTPLNEAAKPFLSGSDAWGDQSQRMTHKQIFVVDTNTRAIPTNDWWTDLINNRYSGDMFAYPAAVNAEDYGIFIKFPKTWSNDGTALVAKSQIEIRGENFKPASAVAQRWGDWTFDFLMEEEKGKSMVVTIGHGLPFTWCEFTGVKPIITSQTSTSFDGEGKTIAFPFTGDHLGIEINGDQYGIYAPEGTVFTKTANTISVEFAGNKQFLIVATLPSKNDLEFFYKYAYSIPRDSKVSWKYKNEAGEITTNWQLVTENLKGESETDLIQGFIPHHYKNSTLSFPFTGKTYATARGLMKMATGTNFSITYKFNGLLPNLPAPKVLKGSKDQFQPERMKDMIDRYSSKAGYGGDTYWGGKDVMYMGQYMMFAHETGDSAAFNTLKASLKRALEDWYTYTPGEPEHFFAWYPNFKSLVGMNASYGSDEFNDHHFHYGYFTYATAMLGLFDKDFLEKYGPMAKMVAKDYANWERNDTRLPYFRNLDPWCGHSWAGGVGDAINGNGQESSSEAIQGWGGLYLLGVATGDKSMRDAGIFGYTLESHAVAEYWFDRDKENIDYTKYTKPYNSNITGQGIGWWTWFSGDPIWMHSIQWLPMSPFLKYLYEDQKFAAWDYSQMWQKKQMTGWDADLGNDSGTGNVLMSYLQVSDADSTAALFDDLWKNNKPAARDNYTCGITYYYTHSHRYYGEIQWDKHTNIPTSTVYYNAKTDKTCYVVYNPQSTEQVCKVYNAKNEQIATFNVPPMKLIAHCMDQELTSVRIESPVNTVEPNKELQLTATAYDQYGASFSSVIEWSVSEGATISNSGVFSSVLTGNYTVTAKTGKLSTIKNIRVGDAPVLTTIDIEPKDITLNKGEIAQFKVKGYDQYGDVFNFTPVWSTNSTDSISSTGEYFSNTIGTYTITATYNNISATSNIKTRFPLSNIALGKPVFSLKDENVGTLASYVNDGFSNTRWSSFHTDEMWIYIDLKAIYNIEKVKLSWEAAFGKTYDIQLSNDSKTWTTAYSQKNGGGGIEDISLTGTGQYIRLNCTKRGSEWGYSLWEFEVYGSIVQGATSQLANVVIDPAVAFIKDNGSVQLTAKGYDQDGKELTIKPSWLVLGSGSIKDGLYTPTETSTGSVTIMAKDGYVSGTATVIVEPTYKPTSITINPATNKDAVLPLSLGVPQLFTTTVVDQFKNPFPSGAKWSTNGGGTINDNGFFIPDSTGNFMIFAETSGIRDTAFITISDISGNNVALFKPVTTSSAENDGSDGAKAVDNSATSRWSSKWTTNEWLQIDLQNNYTLSDINIKWEAAYAKKYNIQASLNGNDWENIVTQDKSKGGLETIDVSGKEARFIRLNCTERALAAYGYSLFEFEVYATGVKITPSLTYIKLSPDVSAIANGTTQQFRAECFDQFGKLLESTVDFVVSGGGTIGNNGLFKASTSGTFQIIAKSGNIKSTANITVTPTDAEIPGYWIPDSIDNTEPIDTTSQNPETAIKTIISKEEIVVYPNPVIDELHIKFGKNIEFNDVRIFDLAGRIMIRKSASQLIDIQLDTRNLKKGVYMIVLSGKKQTKLLKVVK